jgi:hypothetical protein
MNRNSCVLLLSSTLGLQVAVACALLSILWPLLAADNIISIGTQKFLILLSALGVFTGVLMFSRNHVLSALWKLIIACPALVACVTLIVNAYMHSNDVFFSRRTRNLSSQQWEALAEDLSKLAMQKLSGSNDFAKLTPSDLPLEFAAHLGQPAEYAYGSVFRTKYGKIFAMVVYGTKSRRWGVYQGGNPSEKWPGASVYQIGTNAWYFVAID